MTVTTLMTADELIVLPDDGARYELVRGELKKMSPTGSDHSRISALIIISLGNHVMKHRLGVVHSSEGGFRISRTPDTVLAPDVAFVRADRAVATSRFFEGAPDLVFEVVSPSDRYTEVEEKTLRWLRAGTLAVVVVNPPTKTARIYRSGSAVNTTDAISVDDVLPGWRLPLAELFA
jgi:Uma2 family endonuclease